MAEPRERTLYSTPTTSAFPDVEAARRQHERRVESSLTQMTEALLGIQRVFASMYGGAPVRLSEPVIVRLSEPVIEERKSAIQPFFYGFACALALVAGILAGYLWVVS